MKTPYYLKPNEEPPVITLDDFRKEYPRYPEISDIEITKEEGELFLNLEPCNYFDFQFINQC